MINIDLLSPEAKEKEAFFNSLNLVNEFKEAKLLDIDLTTAFENSKDSMFNVDIKQFHTLMSKDNEAMPKIIVSRYIDVTESIKLLQCEKKYLEKEYRNTLQNMSDTHSELRFYYDTGMFDIPSVIIDDGIEPIKE